MANKKAIVTSWYNITIVVALCLGSLTYGYAFSIISTTLGQPGFYTYFDLSTEPTSPRYAYSNRITGATSGLFSAGAFMGCWNMGWICDSLGRKKSLYIATVIAIIGSALQAGSVAIPMFLVARWLTGFGVGNLVTLIPIMQAEITPPASRGFLVAQHGVVLVTGYAIAGWVGYACYYTKNEAFQWRFPLSLACVWPTLLLAVCHWIPESPRWLLLQKEHKRAWDIVSRLHQDPNDPDDTSARAEFYQMSQQVESDRTLYENESVWTLFTKPSYRRRMLCGFMTFFSNESSGILVIFNFAVLIYTGLGISGSGPLLISGIYVTIGALGNFVNSLLIDRIGRKMLFVIGLSGCLVSLIITAILTRLYTGSANTAGLSATIFAIFLHLTFYGCCIDANSFVYASEIFPTHIRTRGMGWSTGTLFLTTIPYLSAAPTAFAAIGWKYYLLFIFLTAINIPIVFLFFPETKGLPLEEVNKLFGDETIVTIAAIADADLAEWSPESGMGMAQGEHIMSKGE